MKKLFLLIPLMLGLSACGNSQKTLKNGNYYVAWMGSTGIIEGYYKRADDSYYKVKNGEMTEEHYNCTDPEGHKNPFPTVTKYKCVENELWMWTFNPLDYRDETYSLRCYFGDGYFYNISEGSYGSRQFFITEEFAKKMNIQCIDR